MSRRMRRLLDVLVALGWLARTRDGYRIVRVPDRPPIARAGWGLLADVIRSDRPLPIEGENRRMHEHLAVAGASVANEVASIVPGRTLLDLGGGAGTFSRAWLA